MARTPEKPDPETRAISAGGAVDENTLPKWPKRSRELYEKFFGRRVPDYLLEKINQRAEIRRMIAEGDALKPIGPEIRSMLDHREELLRRFLDLEVSATDQQVLDALKAAVFDGFKVVTGDPSPERWGEVIQIAALLGLDPDPEPSIRAACITVQDRLKARGVYRSFDTIRKDFYDNGGVQRDHTFFPLIHSGILGPLYDYGRANPRTVNVTWLWEIDGEAMGETLAGVLFFALRGELKDTSRTSRSRRMLGSVSGGEGVGADWSEYRRPGRPCRRSKGTYRRYGQSSWRCPMMERQPVPTLTPDCGHTYTGNEYGNGNEHRYGNGKRDS
jgi:hypothetical protein